MKWSRNLPVVKTPRYQQRRNLYMKWSGNLPVVKKPRYQQRWKLYMKWSGNLPVVKNTTQPTATESLHEMVWKLTSG
jgi:hypothetical protein